MSSSFTGNSTAEIAEDMRALSIIEKPELTRGRKYLKITLKAIAISTAVSMGLLFFAAEFVAAGNYLQKNRGLILGKISNILPKNKKVWV